MEFEYCFKITDQKVLRMEIMPNDNIKGDLNILSEWLISDAQDGEYELQKLRAFIEGTKSVERFWGNAFKVKIKKDYATIKWSILKLPDSCTLPTQMLYEILQIWVAKKNELREEKEKRESEENK